MAIYDSKAGKCIVAATVAGIVCLGIFGDLLTGQRYYNKGYWGVGSDSASVFLFITACISVYYNAILVGVSFKSESVAGSIATSTYFLTCHAISAIFYVSSAIAVIANYSDTRNGERIAGFVFGLLAGVLHGVVAFFIHKGD